MQKLGWTERRVPMADFGPMDFSGQGPRCQSDGAGYFGTGDARCRRQSRAAGVGWGVWLYYQAEMDGSERRARALGDKGQVGPW